MLLPFIDRVDGGYTPISIGKNSILDSLTTLGSALKTGFGYSKATVYYLGI